MAIKLEDGRYVKLDISNCFIDINGTHVGYECYKSQEDRETLKVLDEKYNEFMINASQYSSKLVTDVLSELGDKVETAKSKDELFAMLSEEQLKNVELAGSIEEDLNAITAYVRSGGVEELEPKLKNTKLLNSLGYMKSFADMNKHRGESVTIYSSAKSSGKIAYDTMYAELKKTVGKEGYKDC